MIIVDTCIILFLNSVQEASSEVLGIHSVFMAM